MKSSYALAALVGFALINTGFLGVYLLSSQGLVGGLNAETTFSSTATVPAQTITATTTYTAASTSTGVTFSTTTAGSTTATSTAVSNSSGEFTSGISGPVATVSSTASPGLKTVFSAVSVVQFFEIHSLALAPGSWIAVAGMWIWRGRMKSRWMDLGFDSDVFGLFVKMKGGKTRLRLLDALSLPKDRQQLALELGLDWKGVDRHLMLMKKYGFVDDKVAYGKVRMYQLTPLGVSLLRLLQELSREDRREGLVQDPQYAPETAAEPGPSWSRDAQA